MRKAIVTVVILVLAASFAWADDPIRIVGPTRLPAGGGLRRAAGVKTIEVVRASPPWTYNHHVDLGAWKGRLYLAWDQCEKDEDVWPSREMVVSSEDGEHWSEPRELFPQGTSTALRMYFFHAPNGRMLAIAGLRTSTDTTKEAKKGGAVVREIHADHTFGDVFTLRRPSDASDAKIPPLYSTASDRGFVEACGAILNNKPFLEQQDYGRLLDERERMKWHDLANWPADEPSREDFDRFGKAMCFFHRADGALVGVMKWGWVILSSDEGKTWSPPTRPATLVTGMAKVWGQRTKSGKFVLVYNPSRSNRWPLVMVSGADGVTFGDMRIVDDRHPSLRYPGLNKSQGAQYVRGIGEWSSDGTWKDDALWIAYSLGKEDICVSRVPVP